MTAQTVEAARRARAARFRSQAIESADLDARLLTGHALGLDLTGLITSAQRQLTPDQSAQLDDFARRRLAGEPVARLVGEKDFWGLPLQLSSATLVPRPDTETVVELALELLRADDATNRPLRIADLGTGSGAILLALLSELPTATGFGTDISEQALQTAAANAKRVGLTPRATFIACDYAAGLSGAFDLIVSNPPYIRSMDIPDLALELLRADGATARPLRIADLGTGSGAILLALLSELPTAQGFGTDISEQALQTAAANALGAGLAPRATFITCDYATGLSGLFDLIVSNPPYIRAADIAGLAVEVRDYDPRTALDGGADGLDAYRALIPQAAGLLAPGAALVVEAGEGQSGPINTLMTIAGLTPTGAPKADLAGISRAVAGRKMPR